MSKTERIINKFFSENLFHKREEERKLKKRALTLRNNKIKNKTSINFSNQQKQKSLNDFALSFISTNSTFLSKNISFHDSLRQNLWNKIFNDSKGKGNISNKKFIFNKGSNTNKSDMFITETKLNNSKSMASYNNLKKLNKSFFNFSNYNNSNNNTNIKSIKKFLNIHEINKDSQFKKIAYNNSFFCQKNKNNQNIKNKSNNADILKYFAEQKKLTESQNNFNNMTSRELNFSFRFNNKNTEKIFNKIIDIKTKRTNVRKDKPSEYMDKLREYKLIDYQGKMNIEKKMILEETYKNNIDYYEDISNNMKRAQDLLNNQFISKLNEYLRFIDNQLEKEKNREIKLFNKVIQFRNEVKKLNIIIKKKESEKNEILKWIYFQIKIKEKILSIPPYYKEIIENKTKTVPIKEIMPNKLEKFQKI